MISNEIHTPLTTVVSYPERGNYGDNHYRGNCTGLLIKDLIMHFHARKVLDPMQGSGTTGDVCKEMNIEYTGLDLNSGFDLVNDEIVGTYDFVFWHPPYWDIVRYSDRKNDLSCSPTYDIYMGRLRICISRLYEALEPNGTLAILIGDKKKNGELYPFFNEIINWKIGKLRQIIIKEQHNTESSRKSYSGAFIPIHHEYVLIYGKES
jgi:DNA modification methylase